MRILRGVVLALAVFAVAAVSGCQSANVDDSIPPTYTIAQADRADMPKEIREILDSGRLTIGSKFDQPLTGYRDEATGRIDGFDAEIGRIIAKRIFGHVSEGDNLEYIETVSSNREKHLADGTVDLVIATYTITPERRKDVTFAGPYYEAGQSIMTRKDDDVEDVDDLSGKDVCTAQGSTSVKNVANENRDAKVDKPLRNYSSCVKALLEGEYDAVSTDDVILYGFANENPSQLEVSDETFTTEPYGIGMPKGSKELQKFINETIKMAFDNGDWQMAFGRTLEAAKVPAPDSPPKITEKLASRPAVCRLTCPCSP